MTNLDELGARINILSIVFNNFNVIYIYFIHTVMIMCTILCHMQLLYCDITLQIHIIFISQVADADMLMLDSSFSHSPPPPPPSSNFFGRQKVHWHVKRRQERWIMEKAWLFCIFQSRIFDPPDPDRMDGHLFSLLVRHKNQKTRTCYNVISR